MINMNFEGFKNFIQCREAAQSREQSNVGKIEYFYIETW